MRFDSGRVALDLVATRAGRLPVEEQLRAVEQLAEWLYGAQLLPRSVPVAVEEAWLPRFTALREVIRRLVTAELTQQAPPPGEIGELNETARPAPPAPRAVPAGDGKLAKALATPPTCEALLAVVARDAVDLFTDPLARSQLRRCEGENCTLVYLDTSRGRRRRWCSSEVCGNRERVARHRRRTTLTAPQR